MLAAVINGVEAEQQFVDAVQSSRGTGEALACAVCLA